MFTTMNNSGDGGYCPRYPRLAIGWDGKSNEALLIRVRCKQWTCPHCAQVNKRQWQRRLIEGIKQLGGSWSFWTLTHDLDYQSYDYVAQRQHLSACFNRLNTRLKRYFGRSAPYARAIEIGGKGTRRMHHHVLWQYDPAPYTTTVRPDGSEYVMAYDMWYEIIMSRYGRIADVRPVTRNVADRPDHEQAIYAASYIAKYMSKQDENIPYPKYTRRFAVSRNWPEAPHEDGFDSGLKWSSYENLDGVILNGYWRKRVHVLDVQRHMRRVSSDELRGKDDVWVDPLVFGES